MRNAQIIVPFDILEFKAGDCIEFIPFITRVAAFISEQNGMIEALQEQLDEREDEIYELNREIDALHENIRDCYRPVDPYVYNGVNPSDFH